MNDEDNNASHPAQDLNLGLMSSKGGRVQEVAVSSGGSHSSLSTSGSVNTSAYFNLPPFSNNSHNNANNGLGNRESSYSTVSTSSASSASVTTSTASHPATFIATLPAATPSAAKLNRRSQVELEFLF